MPVGYGTAVTLPQLSSEQLSTIDTTSTSSGGGFNWLSWLLSAVEIGLTFVPTVGTGVATAIALANAGAQTGVEIAETGKVSPMSAGINFGSAFLPGATSYLKGFRQGTISGQALDVFSETGQTFGKDFKNVGETLYEGLSGQKLQSTAVIKDMISSGKVTGKISHIVEDSIPASDLYDTKSQELIDIITGRVDSVSGRVRDLTKFQSNLADYAGAIVDQSRTLGQIAEMGGNVAGRDLKYWTFKDGKFQILKGDAAVQANKEAIAAAKKSIRALRISRGGTSITETVSDATSNSLSGEEKTATAVARETGLFLSEIRQLRAIVKDGVITKLWLWRKILTKAYQRTGNKFLEMAVIGSKQGKFLKLLTRTETTAMKMSRISSKTIGWATKIGGYITSPSSLAADAISKTVAKLTSKVEEIGEELTEKLNKWFKMGAKGIKHIEEEFERTGGTVFKSKWILGFKILQMDDISSSILVQFRNEHPNVLTKLSHSKLKAWVESSSKGRWYVNNIARSRGGRPLSDIGIEGDLENLLGMLPISKINEIVGFASFSKGMVTQIRANSGTLIWHTGNYIQGFQQGLIQGIIAEGIKGAVALGTTNQYAKQVLEGGFGAAAGGQTFGTAFSASFQGATASLRDTRFEDNTKSGSIVKNVKVVQASGNGFKGVL